MYLQRSKNNCDLCYELNACRTKLETQHNKLLSQVQELAWNQFCIHKSQSCFLSRKTDVSNLSNKLESIRNLRYLFICISFM